MNGEFMKIVWSVKCLGKCSSEDKGAEGDAKITVSEGLLTFDVIRKTCVVRSVRSGEVMESYKRVVMHALIYERELWL